RYGRLPSLRLCRALHTKKLRPDFENKDYKESYYDLRGDWHLIEASFAKQYGIRLRSEKDMPFEEFVSLLSGLMPDTPLGQIVSIRSEKDSKVIKNFTKEQKRIHSEWKLKMANRQLESPETLDKTMDNLAKM